MPERPSGVLLDKAASVPPSPIEALVAPSGSILVIAPHPDDETLGCGAAITAALECGRDVTIALMTDGDASHPASARYPAERLAALRRSEFEAAVARLRPPGSAGTLRTLPFGLPDTRLAEAVADGFVLDRLSKFLDEADCASIWSTWRFDPHCDHHAAADIADRLAQHMGQRLHTHYAYAVWGRFGDAASLLRSEHIRRFALDRWQPQKLEAMACYRSQLTPLITDDPDGFVMPSSLVDHFGTFDEIFIERDGAARK